MVLSYSVSTFLQDKSNEITALPVLINKLDIKDIIVSINAMGCQKEVAKAIRGKEAHYFLSVKMNQEDLFEEVSESFKYHKFIQSTEQWEYDHGKYEQRECFIQSAREVLSPKLLSLWLDI